MNVRLIFFLFICLVTTAMEGYSQKICLNMIVKDESDVIERCLTAVKPYIDYWVIVDTGSSDGTQALIKRCLKDIPGELHEQSWINFAHNRNQALQLAKNKGDYLFFIDADEVFTPEINFKMPQLDKDFYLVMMDFGGMSYGRVHLIKNALDWKWVGAIHETVECDQAHTSGVLPSARTVVHTDGARSKDPNKYYKDIALCEQELAKNPNSTRYMFYLAQSYKDAGELAQSIHFYEKRASMGGWPEEVFWSLFQVANLKERLGYPETEVEDSYLRAYQYRPTRLEPIFHLAQYYRLQQRYQKAFLLGQLGKNIPLPTDLLFLEKWIYDYEMLFELSISAFYVNKFGLCYKYCLALLANPNLPIPVRAQVEKNLKIVEAKLNEILGFSKNSYALGEFGDVKTGTYSTNCIN